MHGSPRRLITTILGAGFIGFSTAALINPLFTTPALASSPLPAVTRTVSRTVYHDLTQADRHGAAMAVTAQVQRAEQRAQHYRWRLYQRHQAAVANAAAAASARQAAVTTAPSAPPSSSYPPASSGTYSYSGLESLWEANGGSSGTAATAACIAEHESSGNPAATNGTDDGLWQILPANFPGDNLFNASVNAADAVKLSGNGTNWTDWSTAPDCGV